MLGIERRLEKRNPDRLPQHPFQELLQELACLHCNCSKHVRQTPVTKGA